MKESMNEIVISIGVILTFLGTLANVYYTRKNIKTTKYIDTVTSERIKWLAIIRTEIVEIITNIHFTLVKYLEENNDIREEISNHQGNYEQDLNSQYSNYEIKTDSVFTEKRELWSQSDYVKHLSLFKLRLNPKEDIQIIEILDTFIIFYTEPYKTEEDIKKAKKMLQDLLFKIQNLLKNEWEKVKKETTGKT